MKKWIIGLIVLGLVAGGAFWHQSKSPSETLVTLQTNVGDVTIKMYPESAPKAVENFVTLAEQGKYNGTIFHRVIPGFMIQGGDYENQNGTGGKSIWGKEFNNEIDPNLSHIRGIVSMANRGPDTNGSQFFIMVKDTPRLDGSYSIFGQVVAGMEVVDTIVSSPRDSLDKPFDDMTIKASTVTTK